MKLFFGITGTLLLGISLVFAANNNNKTACPGGKKLFPVLPMDESDLEMITPMGQTWGSHVTPTDHQYWAPHGGPESGRFFDVKIPGDGVLREISMMPNQTNDYHMTMDYGCGISTIYIHLKNPPENIKQTLGTRQNAAPYLPLKAGDIIGQSTDKGFDFSVTDINTRLKGFIRPKSYGKEPWKLRVADPFDYFEPHLKEILIKKVLRSVPPLGGKIDFDVDGRISGNWFKQGSRGYNGTKESRKAGKYWKGHLTLAYNHFDPRLVVISIGDFGGESKQFTVKRNTPDPKDIGVKNGMVKYELIPWEYKIGDTEEYWDRKFYAKDIRAIGIEHELFGTVAFQLVKKRKLKMEIFPGKPSSEVTGFSDKARYYVR